MTEVVIASIVEGQTEVRALPILLRRIATELLSPSVYLNVATPHRLPSDHIRVPSLLEPALRMQAARVRGRGGILVLRDGDDKDVDCPVRLAGEITPALGVVTARVEVVIARHEFEAWMLAAVDSLRDHRDVRGDAQAPADPEAHRGAWERLEKQLLVSYKKTVHPQKFCALMDLASAYERSRSFRRLVHAVEQLIGEEGTSDDHS